MAVLVHPMPSSFSLLTSSQISHFFYLRRYFYLFQDPSRGLAKLLFVAGMVERHDVAGKLLYDVMWSGFECTLNMVQE